MDAKGGSAPHPHSAAWPRIGKRVPSKVRAVDRGRWFEIQPGRLVEVGWGDLSYADLLGLHLSIGDVAAVVLPGPHGVYEHIAALSEASPITVDDVVEQASVVVTADLGAVAVAGSTPMLASIDRALLRDAVRAVYERPASA